MVVLTISFPVDSEAVTRPASWLQAGANRRSTTCQQHQGSFEFRRVNIIWDLIGGMSSLIVIFPPMTVMISLHTGTHGSHTRTCPPRSFLIGIWRACLAAWRDPECVARIRAQRTYIARRAVKTQCVAERWEWPALQSHYLAISHSIFSMSY